MFASSRRGRNDANFEACVDQEANRLLGHWPGGGGGGGGGNLSLHVRPGSFPNCMAPCISELPCQIWYGTSKGNLWSKIVDAEGQDSMYGRMWTYFAGGDEPSRM